MSGKTHSLEPAKSTTEQLRTQLTGEHPKEAIFDFLMANPDAQFSYSEIGDAVDRHKQNVRKHLLKMQDGTFEMNGEVFDGIVYQERDGRTLQWQIRPQVHDQLHEPPMEIIKREVETTVPRHTTLRSFLDDHFELIGVLLFLLTTGAVIQVLELIVDSSLGAIGMVLFVAGAVGVGTMLAIGYGETRISD